jgi:hypothetical protein
MAMGAEVNGNLVHEAETTSTAASAAAAAAVDLAAEGNT